LPTWTLPKLRLLAVAVSDPRVTPEPESGTVNVGFEALTVAEIGLDLLRRFDGIWEALVVTDVIPFWLPLAFGVRTH